MAYVGHSMGSTALYYLMAKDYSLVKENVSIAVALAPAAKITATSSPIIRWVASQVIELQKMAELFNMYEVVSSNKFTNGLMYFFCGYIPEVCYLGMVLLTDK